MNLWLRMLWLWLVGRHRSAVSALGPCRTPFRVWPTDLDLLRHMNNGIYFSIMDLARVDLMMRSKMAAVVSAKGWYPVVVAETIQFRRSLNLFDRFEIETRVMGWDEKALVLQQQFLRRGEVTAHALIRARFLRRTGGSVDPAELAAALGVEMFSTPGDGYASRWNHDQQRWQGS